PFATFAGLDGMTSLSLGPVRTPTDISIEVFSDPQLKTLTIGAIRSGGSVEIDGDAALTSIQFTGLIQVTGSVEIDANSSLASIQFNGGTIGQNLEITNNQVLSSLTGPLSLVAGNLEIFHNPNLSNQAATAWAASITVGGTKEITQNKTP